MKGSGQEVQGGGFTVGRFRVGNSGLGLKFLQGWCKLGLVWKLRFVVEVQGRKLEVPWLEVQGGEVPYSFRVGISEVGNSVLVQVGISEVRVWKLAFFRAGNSG